MRIAATATGPNPQSRMDLCSGRMAYHQVYDTDRDAWAVLDHPSAAAAAHGAGITAAQAVLRADGTVLLAGQCTRKAQDSLNRGGVRVVPGEQDTATEPVPRFLGC